MSRTSPTKAQILEGALGALGRENAQLRDQVAEMGRVLLQILLQEPNNMLDLDLLIPVPDNFRGISYVPSKDGTRAMVLMQLAPEVEAEAVEVMENEGGPNWVQLDPESAGDD